MTWLTPLTGLWLALAVIPPLIVLYFLKLRRRPQAIATTLLWKKSIEDLRANAPFQKLRRSLLLLLQLIALTLLAISVMQPQIHAGSQRGGKSIILIDNSASMTSTNLGESSAGGGPLPEGATRLDEAKRLAKEKVEALYSGGLFASRADETMVIAFSDRAEIACRFTDSKQQLLTAIDRIQPTHGETNIGEALKLARAYTTNVNPDQQDRPIADPATIELYSDGRIGDLADQVLRGETMVYHPIGSETADNVAIAGVAVERPFDRPDAIEVFIALLNFNLQPVTCDIQLSVDTIVRSIQETQVAAATKDEKTGQIAPGRANVVFTPFEQPRGAVIEIANLRKDDLHADNVAQVVVAPPKKLTVALVADNFGRSIVLKVLEGMRLERLEKMSPARFESLATQGGLDNYDVIVMDGVKPTTLPPGRYLTFGPTPPVEGMNEFGDGERQVILSAKDDHPVMRFVNYDKVFIARYKQIQPAEDVKVLLEGSGGPAAVTVSRGPLQLIHCTFSPLETNWPFEKSFVTFIVNAVDHLGQAGQALTIQGLKPGEAISARLPADATDIQLLTPDSATPQRLSPQDPTQLAWGPIRVTGPYLLTWRAGASEERHERAFAVNLLSEREGRVDMQPKFAMGGDSVVGSTRDESVYTPLWPWAIGVCLAVLMIEWWVYHRKAYV